MYLAIVCLFVLMLFWNARLVVMHPGCVVLDFSSIAVRMTLIVSDKDSGPSGLSNASWYK